MRHFGRFRDAITDMAREENEKKFAIVNKYNPEELKFWEGVVTPVIKAVRHDYKVKDIYEVFQNQIMEEDDTPYGGRSFDDETYGDFIEENDIDRNMSIGEFNQLLHSCGLKEIIL